MAKAKNKKVGEDTPEGTAVLLVEDDGSVTKTRTRSAPWKLGHGELVVMVEGRAGGYMASRLTIDEGRGRIEYRRPDFYAEADDENVTVIGFPQWDSEEDQKLTLESVANYGRRMFAAGLREAQAGAEAAARQASCENLAIYAEALAEGAQELERECERYREAG